MDNVFTVDMSLESNHDDDERNDESDSNNDPEFSKEFDEKMFRAVHRRLNSDDFWQYVRFETEDLVLNSWQTELQQNIM